jgi:hypothetical protein
MAAMLLSLSPVAERAANAQITITGGQNKGYNAVWSAANTITGSTASIDASNFSGDVCAKISSAISAAVADGFTTGVVIDARGAGTGVCTSSPTTNSNPATILLPAGTITLPSTWTLGNETRLIGLGRNQTTIKPAATFTGSAVIEMGSSSACPSAGCTGVVVSELWVQGASTGTSLTGIENGYSNQFSYVEHVSITNFDDNGLLIEGAIADGINTYLADGSGPYTDLIISSVNATATSCVNLQARTNGIHGLTCTSNGSTLAGIYLDGSGNTIEDVHFEGVVDGILVGSQHTSAENSVINITGLNGSGNLTNDIHVSNAQTSGSPNVKDLTLLGISPYNLTISGGNALKDDLTGIDIPRADNIALYALGESFGGGYTLFGTTPITPGTTSGLPTWGVGTTNVGSETCNTPGSLYSNPSGASGSTVFVCTAAKTWQSLQ